MSWWKKGAEDVNVKKGVDALGVPCLWHFFKLDCPMCARASDLFRKAEATGDKAIEDRARAIYAKKTPFALAFFACEHESLTHLNNKLVLIVLPIRDVVGAMSERLQSGEWSGDPVDLNSGYTVVIWKTQKQGEQFPKWYVKKGKDFPVSREKLIALYEKLQLPNPKQDKGAFLNWVYNKHPELIVVSGADIPLNTEVTLRILPWPWVKSDGSIVPEPEVDREASPFKVMRFHRVEGGDVFSRLKEVEFDISKFQPKEEDMEEDIPDLPDSSEAAFDLDEV